MEPTDNHYVHRFNEAINREARSNLYNKLCNFNENVRLGPALKPSGEASGLPLTPEESRWLVGVYLLYSLMDKGNVEEMPRYISLEKAVAFQYELGRKRPTPEGWINGLGEKSKRPHNFDDPTVLTSAIFYQHDPKIYLNAAEKLVGMYKTGRLPRTYCTREDLKDSLVNRLLNFFEEDTPEKIALYWNLLEQLKKIDSKL